MRTELDYAAEAHRIADAAVAQSASTGTRCRLRNQTAIEIFVRGIASGQSRRKAAKAAQISEGVVRHWLRLADSEGGVYAMFRDLANLAQTEPCASIPQVLSPQRGVS